VTPDDWELVKTAADQDVHLTSTGDDAWRLT